MYYLLDKFFFVFHTMIIAFNLFGWIWQKTRRANLMVLSLTGASWFVLGIWYGIGYCPCTDWHWQVRMELGHLDMPNSYVKFLIDSITGLEVPAGLADEITAVCFGLAVVASLYTNWRDWKISQSS